MVKLSFQIIIITLSVVLLDNGRWLWL